MSAFFFSYAHDIADEYLTKFFDELCRSVKLKPGVDSRNVAYLDTEDNRTGAYWESTITRELRECQAFVAVLAPPYFNSEYCGREWAAFRKRQEQSRRPDGTLPPYVFPVLWVPEEDLTLPEFVREIQYAEGFADVYKTKGLYRMLKHGDQWDDVVNSLADGIGRALRQPLPPLPDTFRIMECNPLFPTNEAGPATAVVTQPGRRGVAKLVEVYAFAAKPQEIQQAGRAPDAYEEVGAHDWKPFYPEEQRTVGLILQGAATKADVQADPVLEIDSNLVDRIKKTVDQNRIVALVLDPWTVNLPAYKAMLREFNYLTLPNLILVVPWNLNDPQTASEKGRLNRLIRSIFYSVAEVARDPTLFLDSITTRDELEDKVAAAILEAKRRIARRNELNDPNAEIVARPSL